MAHFTDSEIIEALLKREKLSMNAAIEQLYRHNQKVITNLVCTRGGSKEDAEDLYQELMGIFLHNVWQGKFSLRDNVQISTYLYGIAKKCWLKKSLVKTAGYKRDTYHLEEYNRQTPDYPDPCQQMIDDEDDARSLSIFLLLDEKDQEFLRAIVQEKLTMEEAKERFKLATAAAAKARKYRIMEKLRDFLRRLKY